MFTVFVCGEFSSGVNSGVGGSVTSGIDVSLGDIVGSSASITATGLSP